MSESPSCSDFKLSVLLPVRNEGVNLRLMLKVLEAVVETPHEVLIVYDFPEDDSIPVVQSLQAGHPNLRLIHNTLGGGVINAIRAGVGAARGEVVLITVVDDVGPVLSIEPMLVLIQAGCDFVSSTRYALGGRRLGGSPIGGALSRLANRLFHWIAGCALTDATTGMKMFRRSVFDQFQLEANPVGWAVVFEMAIKAQYLGLKLGEVPLVSIDRLYGGESSFHLGSWTIEYLRWFLWGAVHLRRHSTRMKRSVAVIPETSGASLAAGVKRS
jgi:glycosyltransferase involved in cell wall biosynthesis